LGSCSGSNGNRPYAYAGTRGGALADITNVAGIRGSQADKVKPLKPSHHSFQPPASAVVPEPPAVAPAAPAVEATVEEKAIVSRVEFSRGEETEIVNVQNVQEYAPDIINQFFRDESSFLPKADYMEKQTDITVRMRTILVDWLVEVHMKYRLRPETLHLTVNLIDRYLTRIPVMRKRLQLVGVVAMFIASKFEEINPPELHDWVYITDNAYTKDDILKMECNMLTTLSFQIVVPTAAHFFDVLEKANACDAVHCETARYLLELGLLDIRMLQYTPSQIVAAALLLSNELLKRSPKWPETMVQQSRQTEQTLRTCADELRQLLEADRTGAVQPAGGQLQAVHKKFSVAQRHGVSKMKF